MATKTKPADELEQLVSTIKLKLLDPFGNAIDGLKYQIKRGKKIVAQGVTDSQGRMQQFASHLGTELSVQVEHFTTGAMKQIHQLTPWNEKMSLKLVSGKVKYKTQLSQDKGPEGDYRRKTHAVVSGDTLGALAANNGTTAQAIATLNGIAVDSVLHIGQLLKLPSGKPSAAAPSPAPTPSSKTTSVPSATTTTPELTAGSVTTEPVVAPTTNTPEPVAVPANVPPATTSTDARGENGTPKTTVALQCNQQSCIKLGDKGPLIEELNIRLMGFGNTISAPTAWNEFTAKTEAAVKQFQRDYMGVPETGRVCGAFLVALDEFRTKYSVHLDNMKCHCGKCSGFGNSQLDSQMAGVFSDVKHTKPRSGIEYPGMHRALLWSLRAAMFYTHSKDKDLTFKFLRISSGYRCWFDNAGYLNGHANSKTKRNSTNHMGNALDLQWTKGNSTARCEGAAVDTLRTEIFVKRLGAQLQWVEKNKLSLETSAQGATSWIHMDVRTLATPYQDTRYYAVTQAGVDGDGMVEIARREGRLALIACGGVLPAVVIKEASKPAALTQRVPIDSLSISEKGFDFIKGWEKLALNPYDDSEGYCTVGWGRLIAKKHCADLVNEPGFKPFKDGITNAKADAMLKEDIADVEEKITRRVQVAMFQQEYDALVSLIFNLGGFNKCPKLLSKLNTGDYSGCCDEFSDVTNGGTSGLVKRRKAEMNIFRNAVYDSTH
jgi:GH24 family phage-related lysozyme (muramidase)/LysM repeat protein